MDETVINAEDTWHVSGLQGTGSNDIVVDDVFVPEHRTHKLMDGFRCKSPGNETNPGPLYRVPFGQLFIRSVSTSSIGIAEAALACHTAAARGRVAQSDGSTVAFDPAAQEVAARARATLDEVRLVLHRNIGDLWQRVSQGDKPTMDERIRFRFDSSRAVERCAQVVDELFTQSGGRAIFLDHPLNTCFADIHAARATSPATRPSPAATWAA